MLNGVLIPRTLIGLHTLVEMIAGLQLLTPSHDGQERESSCGGYQHGKTCDSIHSCRHLLRSPWWFRASGLAFLKDCRTFVSERVRVAIVTGFRFQETQC